MAAGGGGARTMLHQGRNSRGFAPDGRLEVFAVGEDSALWHLRRTAPNGAWSQWFSHGAPPVAGLAGSPAVAATSTGERFPDQAPSSSRTTKEANDGRPSKTRSPRKGRGRSRPADRVSPPAGQAERGRPVPVSTHR